MTVVSVSMPDSLVERIDEFVENHGYTGRSEVIREAAKDLLAEFEQQDLAGRHLMSVVTVLFNYENPTVEHEMTLLRHRYESLVTSNLHSHVGEGYCMELFILEGSLEDVSEFVGKIRATKDTLSVNYSVLPIDTVDQVAAETD